MIIANRKLQARGRRGFATIVAIFLIAFIGVALAGLTLRLSADARRTEKEAVDSQLRQLIVAGEVQTREMHGQAGSAPAPIVMAPPINGEDAQVIIHFATEDKSSGVKVEARLGPRYVKEEILDRTK